MDKMKSCARCRHFKPDGRPEKMGGSCFRFPPSPSFALATSGDYYFENLRPYVSNDEWCGEFMPTMTI